MNNEWYLKWKTLLDEFLQLKQSFQVSLDNLLAVQTANSRLEIKYQEALARIRTLETELTDAKKTRKKGEQDGIS